MKRAALVRDDHFGPVWTDKRHLVVVPRAMQGRSRLIVGTSGMGKTVDAEREAFIVARAGRKFFLVDGKGTDPGFVERALAGYLWGNPHARIALWPELPMDGWRGTPAAIHNRLVAMLGWTEPYYKDVASLLLRLALNAPGEDGPIRSSSALMVRMDPEVLVRLYEHDPDRRREAESLVGDGVSTPVEPGPAGPRDGHRLRLAVAAAAHDGDQAATAALVREGVRRGLDVGELVAVAERHWPRPRLRVRAWRTGRRWTAARLRRLHRPRRRVVVVAEQERSQ